MLEKIVVLIQLSSYRKMLQTRSFLSNLFLTDLETGRLKIKVKGSSASGKDPAFADKLLPTSSREVQCCVVIQKKRKKRPFQVFP